MFLAIKEGVRECTSTWVRYNMAEVLATAGALWTSIYGIILALGKNYQIFTYDKSLLKRLFFVETNNGGSDNDSESGEDTSSEKAIFKKRL